MGLERIYTLIERGDFDQALELTDQISDNIIEAKILKSRVLEELGEFSKAYDIASAALTESKTIGSSIDQLAAITAMIYPQMRLGNLESCEELIDQARELIEQMPKKDTNKAKRWIATFYHIHGTIIHTRGRHEKAISKLELALDLRKEIGYKRDIALTMNNIGLVYWYMGEPQTSLNYYKQIIPIYKELGNEFDIAVSLVNLGEIYQRQGELDLALKNYLKSLEIKEKINNKHSLSYSLTMLGRFYLTKGEPDMAVQYLNRAIEIDRDIDNQVKTSETLYYLILAHFESENQKELRNYLEEIEKLHNNNPNKFIEIRAKIAYALYLKHSNRAVKIMQSQELFEEIVNDKIIDHELTVFAMINLAEILLLELKAYGEEEVLEEVEGLLNKLLTFAEEQRSFPLLVDVLLLQSNFVLLDGNFVRAESLLDEALEITREKGLIKLQEKIISSKESLQDELQKWSHLIKQNTPITQKLEQSRIQEYLEDLMNLMKGEHLN